MTLDGGADTGGLKGIDGVNLTQEELDIEAAKQAEAVRNYDGVIANRAQRFLDNRSAAKVELQEGFDSARKRAIDAGKADQAATGGTLASENVALIPKRHWYDRFVSKK